MLASSRDRGVGKNRYLHPCSSMFGNSLGVGLGVAFGVIPLVVLVIIAVVKRDAFWHFFRRLVDTFSQTKEIKQVADDDDDDLQSPQQEDHFSSIQKRENTDSPSSTLSRQGK